jgi:hypothetical protein
LILFKTHTHAHTHTCYFPFSPASCHFTCAMLHVYSSINQSTYPQI